MQERLKIAALGGLIGAAVVIIALAGAAALNILPVASDARLQSYLLAHPQLVVEMQTLAEAQQADEARQAQLAAIKKIGLKNMLDPKVAFVTGPANAKNTVIEFYDYNCGHCRNNATVVKAFYAKHKADTRFAFIEFPIFGNASATAAQASVAARNQADKFLAFHFELMDKGAADSSTVLAAAQTAQIDVTKLMVDMHNPAAQKSLLAGYRLAREMQFNGTPMFIVNGEVHEGEITEAELKKLMK